jgi:Fe-S-cluster containining protein
MMAKRTLKDARWSCQSCGSCCRGFSFGPVEEHIVQGLKERDIVAHWAPAKTEWYVKHPQTGELYFTHIDGHCVFLQEDNRCAIHARWGSKAKPWFCREYPFSIVEDEQGVSVTIRDDCGGFHKSMDQGDLVSEQLDDVFDIVRLVPRQRFAPQQVVILPGLGVSVANWLQVEFVLLEACQGTAAYFVAAI